MADGAEESGRGVMSLRLRLIVGPAAVMIAAIALALLLLVHQARLRIVAERTSSIALAEELVAQALANISGRDSSVLAELARRMPAPRHVRLVVLSEEAPSAPAAAPVDDGLAPGWFVHLIRPAAWEERRDIVVDGVHRGQVLITSDPDDEIAEIWQEFRVLAALPLGLTALFVTLVVWSVNRALRPLTQLRAGLGRLAAGDFAASLPPLGSAELEPLGGIFNRLAESLRRLTADNRLLITKLLSVRESERSELAHELHDELGPCLFGIRAQAACVARASSLDEAARQAGAIQSLADDLQRLNQRILARLRPAALADLGLGEAARRLVEDWRERCPAIEWSFLCGDLAAEPTGPAALAAYRIIQEALTNAARHSGARRVDVELASGPAASLGVDWSDAPTAWLVQVAVRDDGMGLPAEAGTGFGLLGMAERARALGGTVRIDGGAGMAVEALIPFDGKEAAV